MSFHGPDKVGTIPPVIFILLVLATATIGFVIVGPALGFIAALPFYPGDFFSLVKGVINPIGHPEAKISVYIIQGFSTFIGLVIGPLLLILATGRSVRQLLSPLNPGFIPALLTIGMLLSFMVLNSLFIDWNAHIHLPDFMKAFEQWAREKEDLAAQLTEFVTQFDSTAQVFIALVVIALLPAIGEELVFRGLIQREFFRATSNIHISIWVSAAMFSAIHLQFFGFVPRMFLGALFGYLYAWSGCLTLPILGHFANNAFSVVGMYFYQQGSIPYDLESPEAASPPWLIASGLLFALLLAYFKKLVNPQVKIQ